MLNLSAVMKPMESCAHTFMSVSRTALRSIHVRLCASLLFPNTYAEKVSVCVLIYYVRMCVCVNILCTYVCMC